MLIGVVADDTTGANDIGIMFSKNGYLTKIVAFDAGARLQADADVIIIDTDSRLDPKEIAYEKVLTATKQLQIVGCKIFHKKTCSVFRGNIGAEFDAVLDALGEQFMIISLAFPKNGRQTVHGIHTVHGKRLECSEFAHDPVHPMHSSDLVAILQEQTQHRVGRIDLDIVRNGTIALRQALESARTEVNYCIIDAQNQDDLTLLASALDGLAVLGGSSALAEELPKYWPTHKSCDALEQVDFQDHNGVLIVAGSLMPQTAAQIAHLQAIEMPVLKIDTREIFDLPLIERKKQEIIDQAVTLIMAGTDTLLMADNSPEIVRDTKAIGQASGIAEMTISKMVSAVLADITADVVAKTNLKRLIIAGGDTSGTLCRKLGITGNIVLREIETGLPSGLALGRHMLIVLKSGSFGKPEFLQTAVEHLKTICYQ
ncbi:serine kinase [Anaerosporomusa subterranea]|uniref:Serine kinase n=1 Tax=Anaerosporomusa subterranea TaxID=1794912 RepID=A0A154BPZ9_ANASB|nr:four-carbon acid sugar kinase family protein [Anaerosporomusa subterranea]KYZ76064.1 serine kinase [Anaerosporomusa subterranea]